MPRPFDPRRHDRPTSGRCAVVGLGAWGAAGALVWLAAPQLLLDSRTSTGPGFVGWLVRLCSLATAGCGLWLALVATVVVLEAAHLRRPGHVPGCPRSVRRWLLAACGATLAAGLATPAVAADRGPEAPPVIHVPEVHGLPLPDRAVAGPRPARPPHRAAEPVRAVAAAGPPAVGLITVRPGDCLWSIADGSLPHGADDAAVTARWHRIFALNRSAIGADPDLIRPGLQLRLPRA